MASLIWTGATLQRHALFLWIFAYKKFPILVIHAKFIPRVRRQWKSDSPFFLLSLHQTGLEYHKFLGGSAFSALYGAFAQSPP